MLIFALPWPIKEWLHGLSFFCICKYQEKQRSENKYMPHDNYLKLMYRLCCILFEPFTVTMHAVSNKKKNTRHSK